MNKKIISLILGLLLVCPFASVSAADNPVAYNGERITFEVTLPAPAGTPVMILIAKPGVTKADLLDNDSEHPLTAAGLMALVDYVGFTTLTDDVKNLSASILISSSLGNGICDVYVACEDTPLTKIGYFDNLNQGVVRDLVEDFNDTALADYHTLFTEENVLILGKINAEVEAYQSLSSKNSFYAYLHGCRPFVDNSATGQSATDSLVQHFNAGIAYGVLGETNGISNVLSVLTNETYNGAGKAWNLDFSEGSLFNRLTTQEQKDRVLGVIDNGAYASAATLEAEFNTQVAISYFLESKNALTVESAISAYNDAYYHLDQTPMQRADFTEYHKGLVYNAMVLGKSSVSNVATLQALYQQSLAPVLESLNSAGSDDDDDDYFGGRGGGGGGSFGGGGIKMPTEDTTPVPVAPTFFTDVPKTHWAYDSIKTLYDKKIISGKSAESFAPESPVTREEFAKIMALFMEFSQPETAVAFADVAEGSWYQSYISAVAGAGLMQGQGNNAFGVGKTLTREDAAVILARALSAKGITLTEGELQFSDTNAVSEYALSAVKAMTASGLIQGNTENMFLPRHNISRAEACALLSRVYVMIGGIAND